MNCNKIPEPVFTCEDVCKCISIKSPDKSIKVIKKGCTWYLETVGGGGTGEKTYIDVGTGLDMTGLGSLINPYVISLEPTLISNWNTAYNRSVTGLAFSTSTGNLTLTKQDGSTIVTNLDGRYLTGTTGDSLYHKQGGNAFGTTSTIGTTDANDIIVIRGNTARLGVIGRGLNIYSDNVGLGQNTNEYGLHIDAWDGTDKQKGAYLGVTSTTYDAQSMPWLVPATTFLGYRQNLLLGTYNNTNYTLRLGSDYKATFNGSIEVPETATIGTIGSNSYIEMYRANGSGNLMSFINNNTQTAIGGFYFQPHPTAGTTVRMAADTGMTINIPNGVTSSTQWHFRIQSSAISGNVRGGMSIFAADGNALRLGVGNGSSLGNVIIHNAGATAGRFTICGSGAFYDLTGPSYAYASGGFLPLVLNTATYRFETTTAAQMNTLLGNPWLLGGNTLTAAQSFGSVSGNFDITFLRNNVTFQTFKSAGIRYDVNQAIGVDAVVNAHLFDTKAIGGATDAYGMYINSQIAVGVTGNAYYYRSNATSITASTTGNIYHYAATQGTLAGTATNQYGLFINSTLTGATNNYALYLDIAAATGRWNVYSPGTAQNQLTGNTGIGGAPDTTEKLKVTGNIITTGAAVYATGSFLPLARNTTSGRLETVTAVQMNTFLGTTTDWAVGGNTVTGTSYVGTNSAHQLNIGAGGTARISITSAGAMTMPLISLGISFTSTTGNTFTLTNDAAFTGDIFRYLLNTTVVAGMNYQGRMSIGSTVPGGGTTFNNSVRLANSTAPEAFMSQGVVGSTVTSSATYYRSLANTEAATTLSAGIYHYNTVQGTFGAGSSIANQYGFFADATMIGATNNYGFYGNIAAATGRWNFYAAGTAANQFTGRTGIGGAPDATELLKVTGNIIATAPAYTTGSFLTLVRNTTSGRFETVTGAQIATATNAILQSGNAFGSGVTIGSTDANSMGFITSGSPRMTISATGQIGIGSTPDATETLRISGNTILAGIPTYATGGYNTLVRNATSGRIESITAGTPIFEIVSTSQSAAVNTRYIANNPARVVFTLPLTAAVGDQVLIRGKGLGGWRLGQNSGQVIHGASNSTTGTGGYIESQAQWDTVAVECVTANTDWIIISNRGTLTIV